MRGVTERTKTMTMYEQFQPALPMRGVTDRFLHLQSKRGFQPALPMRGVTGLAKMGEACAFISTRTPHAGSDYTYPYAAIDLYTISTRTAHAGSDPITFERSSDEIHFNPHSPCGE